MSYELFYWKEVLNIRNGKSQKEVIDPDGPYPIYGSGGIIGYANDFICNENTVIIGRKGSINNPIYVKEKFWNVDTAFGLEVNREYLASRYLYYFCIKYNFEKLNTTVTIPSLTKANLLNIKISLPILETQKKIVEILDKAQELIDQRKEQIKEMDNLVQSLFYDMFGDPVTNPMGWEVKKLAYYLNSIDSGWSPKCNANQAPIDSWAVLKLSSVTGGYYLPNKNKELPKELEPKIQNEVKVKDLLFTRKNTPELVGSCAYVFKTPNKLMLPDLIFRLVTNTEISKIYIWKLFNIPIFRSNISSLAGGSAASMVNISKAKLNDFEIPTPPIELQTTFANRVKHIEQQKEYMTSSLKELEDNFNCLMQKAFKGELVS